MSSLKNKDPLIFSTENWSNLNEFLSIKSYIKFFLGTGKDDTLFGQSLSELSGNLNYPEL